MTVESKSEKLMNIQGLSTQEVEKSKLKYGDNTLESTKKKGFWRQFIANFGDPIIKILLIALFINVIFMFRNFDWYESVGIAIAIFLATFVSTLSEYGSELAFEELQEESSKTMCRVNRNGSVITIQIGDIVVGDIVYLQVGEKVPADGVVVDGNLLVDQSSLNGESKEVTKRPSTLVNNDWNLAFSDQVFRGSVICGGEGIIQIGRVGNDTFYGNMASEMQEETRESPLRVRLNGLAKTISHLGYIAAFVVAFAYLFNAFVLDSAMQMPAIVSKFRDFPFLFEHLLGALTLAITVIVVAVPEGLPMMITVVLSSNMKRMLKDKVLVRKLVGIETAGSLNLLFTDKTGTLTQGKPTVSEFMLGDGTTFKNASALKRKKELYELVKLSSYYNTGSMVSEKQVLGGNATDRALLEYFMPHAKPSGKYRILDKIPFDSAKKFSSIHITGDRDCYLVKGAPEKIIHACTGCIDESGKISPRFSKNFIQKTLNGLTSDAVRVIAVAYSQKPISPDGVFSDMVFVGLFCISDAIRKEAKQAIQDIKNAGIQVVMITGDNKQTALSISKKCSLVSPYEPYIVMTSEEMAELSDDELKQKLPQIRVIARALPTDKSRLVRLAQEMGLVVGMTGDGVNDAPALKKSDVGFAMGSGTEVAKEAGDIVIMDNNIASIEKAILYGRTIFKSIRKFIIFQLTMNLCAVGISIIGPFIGIDAPVTVIQMLWINIIMDTLGGLAFAGEVPLKEYMREMPKKRDEKILNSYMVNQIVFTGVFTIALCLLFLTMPVTRGIFCYADNSVYFMTAFFALFIFSAIFNCFNARTHRINLLAHLSKNKTFILIMLGIFLVQIGLIYRGGTLFRTTPLHHKDVLKVLLMAALVIPIDLSRKIFLRMHGRKGRV